MKEFSEGLRARRQELGLTQAEAAGQAGVSERFVRALETGKQTVQLDKVLALAGALGLELRLVPCGGSGPEVIAQRAAVQKPTSVEAPVTGVALLFQSSTGIDELIRSTAPAPKRRAKRTDRA